MKNTILVTLLASTLGFGAAAVHANDMTDNTDGQGYTKQENGKHAGKRGDRRGGGQMMKRMAEKLNLTEAQQAQLKTFKDAQKTQHQALRAEMKSLRTEMQSLDTTSANYQTQVATLATKKANLDRKRFIQRSAARQQFESVLTAEQRVKLQEMQANRKNRHGKRNAG